MLFVLWMKVNTETHRLSQMAHLYHIPSGKEKSVFLKNMAPNIGHASVDGPTPMSIWAAQTGVDECHSLLLFLWETPWPQAIWGWKGLFHLISQSSSWRKVRVGTRGKKCCRGRAGMLFPGMLLSLFGYLSYTSQDPAQVWHCPQCAVPSHVNHSSRKGSVGVPPGQSDGGIFWISGPSS